MTILYIPIASQEFEIDVDFDICTFGIKIHQFTVDGVYPDNSTWDYFIPYIEDAIMRKYKLLPFGENDGFD